MVNQFYEAAAQWDQVPRRLMMARAIADAMVRQLNLSNNQTVMDYGTGTGLIALNLRSHAGKIIAVDSSPGMLEVLQQKLQQDHITTIETREWSVGQETNNLPGLDAIVSSMTLHHVKDTAAVARTFYRLLVPGGQIAIADLDEENGEFHNNPQATEHNGFNRESLRDIFEQAGFASLRFSDAHTIRKEMPDGRERSFSVFLMTGKRLK